MFSSFGMTRGVSLAPEKAMNSSGAAKREKPGVSVFKIYVLGWRYPGRLYARKIEIFTEEFINKALSSSSVLCEHEKKNITTGHADRRPPVKHCVKMGERLRNLYP